MDIRKLVSAVSKYEKDICLLEKYMMRYYIESNEIQGIEGTNVQLYISSIDEERYFEFKEKLVKYFQKNKVINFDIDTMINIYELLIPSEEKKENGMFFTPKEIKEYISSIMIDKKENIKEIKICDPSCGCASFLITVSKYIAQNYKISYREIFGNIIYGVDIYQHNIEKAKLLFTLLALENKEEIKENIKFNLCRANSLEFDFEKNFKCVFSRKNSGFDIVIGNPPYVRGKNINLEIKESLKKWKVTQIGNKDLYIAFFQLGLELLNTKGKLGYISVNSYLTSLNGRLLREYLIDEKCTIDVIDFKDSQIFKGVTSYTCISVIRKSIKRKTIKYVRVEDISNIKNVKMNEFSYDELDSFNGWDLGDVETVSNIKKIKRFERKLEYYGIKNGIATLKNDVFIFKPKEEDDKFYYFKDINDVQTKVEKSICKKIIKPNTLKNNSKIEEKLEYIIYPYYMEKKKNILLDEEKFRIEYEYAYNYLKRFKNKLLMRDKGKAEKKYPNWYAFGRTQGMMNQGKKIFLPYIAKEGIANLCLDEDVLFYCGYALFSNDVLELQYIQKIMLSKIFWYYVHKTSKPYSGGYMSFAKSYIKDFSIPEIDDITKRNIVNEKDKSKIDKILSEIYDIKNI